jgi:hypothetical protein
VDAVAASAAFPALLPQRHRTYTLTRTDSTVLKNACLNLHPPFDKRYCRM